MPANAPAPRKKALFRLSCLALAAASCGRHEESAKVPEPKPPPAAEAPRTAVPEADTAVPAPGPVAAVPASPGLAFVSHPPKALLGKPFKYRPAFDFPGAVSVRLAKGADSSMRLEKGAIEWVPTRSGRYPVVLEASAQSYQAKQAFTLEVAAVLDLVLKALPAQADKGDTVLFDLRGSRWPAWAATAITLRFDWDGDGSWDAEKPAGPSGPIEAHVYGGPGRYSPRIEARYGAFESREARGSIAIVSPVTAVLSISPDTVEPGAEYRVDASASRSDGRLSFSLDVDGDGKPEWADSSTGKAVLRAPAAGTYRARLVARNPMGQEGGAEAMLRVNARPKIEFRVRNPKDHMAAAIDFKIQARDPDDSVKSVRFTWTGGPQEWETRAAPDSQGGPNEWRLRLKHAYGKAGKFVPKACATAADGREACQELQVEIFNAPPECRPGADLRATLGQPVAIEGDGVDPDGKIVKWEWDLDNDGKYDLVSSKDGRFQYTFGKEGKFDLALRVTTADGMTAIGRRKVEVRKKWKT